MKGRERCDSEYFKQVYIQCEEMVRRLPHVTVGDWFHVTDGEHGSVDFVPKGVRFLTAENVKEGFIQSSGARYVSKAVDERNRRSRVRKDDVLISIKGTLGEVAMAEERFLPANMNRDVAILKSRSENNSRNAYLALFLMSSYGMTQSLREGSGGVQQMITLGRLRSFLLPIWPEEFYLTLERMYRQSQECLRQSEALFCEGERYLAACLGGVEEATFCEAHCVKSFHDSFLKSKRFDAEYCMPEYEAFRALLTSYRHGWQPAQKVCRLRDALVAPEERKEYMYLELADIGRYGEVSGCTRSTGGELPTRARRQVRENDVLVSSLEGSLESCALTPPECDGALCSTGFYVLDSDVFNPETLLLLFKSVPVQKLMKRGCSGTIMPAISREELMNLPLPLIEKEVQEVLTARLRRSRALRGEARRLLEQAKTMVEKAVEGAASVEP